MTAAAHYYESIDFRDATHPQTILAYEMNDRALPVEHGAPLRLRIETQLGYKHAKYIRKIEFVPSYENIAAGQRRLLGRSRLRVVRGNLTRHSGHQSRFKKDFALIRQ